MAAQECEMSKLELRIPPVAVALIIALVVWLISRTLPTFRLFVPNWYSFAAGLAAAGLAVGGLGVISFRQAKTTGYDEAFVPPAEWLRSIVGE